jgi:hypothetical protein
MGPESIRCDVDVEQVYIRRADLPNDMGTEIASRNRGPASRTSPSAWAEKAHANDMGRLVVAPVYQTLMGGGHSFNPPTASWKRA